ncbi:hypothetical protein OH723_24270 [Streptomyces albidoflavus]|uniref:hypothetical protein n=1 Tax=Streptomyces albidoflavus TaxID=1886 RepID=UPI003863526E|nr:hypothetical protein OH723_24270 [Streptomyces albidoflavus]
MIKVTVAWPEGDSTMELLTYPRVGEFLPAADGEMWEVTRVAQEPAPNAEYIVTVDKPVRQP